MPTILDGGQTASRMLQQYDNEKYREEQTQERQQISEERSRHNQALEELDRQRMQIAKMQTDAKLAAEQLKIKAAEDQARDITGATTEIGKIKPDSDTYQADMAALRGKYPAAFLPSKNGVEGTLLDYVKHLDTQNEQVLKANNQADEQAEIFAREHGIRPEKVNGKYDYQAAQAKLNEKMKAAPPSGLQESEETRSSTGAVTERFTAPKSQIPNSVKTIIDKLTGQIAGNQQSFQTAKEKDKPALVSQYKELIAQRDAINADFNPGAQQAPKATAAAQDALHPPAVAIQNPEDQQAIDWANSNSTDPRAKKILQLHSSTATAQ